MNKYKSHTIVYSSLLFLLSYLPAITLSTSSGGSPKYALEGCEDKCGKVRIPYPFGMGAECSLNEWYAVDCDSSTPYLRALNRLQVLGVDLENQTVTVNMSSNSVDHLGGDQSPFFYSKLQNKFVFEGCGNAVLTEHGRVLTGCSATCNDTTSININARTGGGVGGQDHTNSNCFIGIGCCQSTLPHHFKSYNTNLTGSGSAVLVDKEYSSYALEGSWFRDNNSSNYVPVSLLWTLVFGDTDKILCSSSFAKLEVDLGNGIWVDSFKCVYSTPWNLEGNAYLIDGCQTRFDSKECAKCEAYGGFCYNVPIYGVDGLVAEKKARCCSSWSTVKADLGNGTWVDSLECLDVEYGEVKSYLGDGFQEECAKCRDSGGSCFYDQIYDVRGLPTRKDFYCSYGTPANDHQTKSSLAVILGVCGSISLLSLVASIYILYRVIMKTKERRQRKRFFERNGGLLLKQQEEADPFLFDKIILFTSHELGKATDNFNNNRIVGRGGHGTVYKGMLVDGRIVAVKKSKLIDESHIKQFINEVVILSQVNHRNVVKLLGCCLETDVPLLVSEFIPNGTVYDRLHKVPEEFPFSLNARLQIATEVAGALAYLHSATSIPIYHRDIKTTNILLDEKYKAKVSDFGTSRFVSIDQTHLTTLVKGTFGYFDPEYFRSSQFTEKSDVYSFGVVLVELLTGEKPVSSTSFGEHRSLVTYFLSSMEEGRVLSIFDAMVVNEGTKDDLLALANLAMRCLNLNGKYRPTMKEVTIELESIRISHTPIVRTNNRHSFMGVNY